MIAFVKIACAVTAISFPLGAGLLIPFAKTADIQIALLALGIGLGMAGVSGFATIEKREG
jgi:hypothetical protein